MRGRVDGLIVMAPHLGPRDLAVSLPKGLPSVLINTREGPDHHPAIHLDNAAGVRAIVDHLADLGRRRLIHIAGPEGNFDAQERAQAFRESVAARRIHGEIVQGDFEMESGERAIAALISSGAQFDAIFAANDNMAIGAIEALRSANISVPDEVAVAGFDDIPLARHLGITTVSVRIAELGERAVARLVDSLTKNDDGSDELHEPELVARSTTVASKDNG